MAFSKNLKEETLKKIDINSCHSKVKDFHKALVMTLWPNRGDVERGVTLLKILFLETRFEIFVVLFCKIA